MAQLAIHNLYSLASGTLLTLWMLPLVSSDTGSGVLGAITIYGNFHCEDDGTKQFYLEADRDRCCQLVDGSIDQCKTVIGLDISHRMRYTSLSSQSD